MGLAFDVLLLTGGVSAGQRDLVPAALEQCGVRSVFHKVRMKPGKPVWFGVGPPRGALPGTLVFGLPGNPASTLVGFLVFVAPALRACRSSPSRSSRLRVRLAYEFFLRGDRATYWPAQWLEQAGSGESGGVGLVETLDWAGSADLLGMARADGFVVLRGDGFSRQEKFVLFCRYANIKAVAPASNEPHPFFRGARDGFHPGDRGGDPDQAADG